MKIENIPSIIPTEKTKKELTEREQEEQRNKKRKKNESKKKYPTTGNDPEKGTIFEDYA